MADTLVDSLQMSFKLVHDFNNSQYSAKDSIIALSALDIIYRQLVNGLNAVFHLR